MMRLIFALLLCLPSAALACGGLFCNSQTPVTQAAERVLFAPEGERMHMHIRLTYAGPPAEFGWLLPVPGDVETSISSEAIFAFLDRWLSPRFMLRTEYSEGCGALWERDGDFLDDDADGIPAPEAGEGGGGVEVLSREAVGPYDRVILRAESVDDLRRWLDENAYQIPEGGDAHLQPYVDLGMAFVALKLLPGADSSDVVPLRLSFTAPVAAIPIRPTSVAANPDMGLLIHLLGEHRAVPTNYAHVHINPAGIDWRSGGNNYVDVVSQAADEANGKAFATDYAGESQPERFELPIFDDDTLDQIRRARSFEQVASIINSFRDAQNRRVNALRDPDTRRVLAASLIVPEGMTTDEVIDRWRQDIPGVVVDTGALAARLEDEVNAPRRGLNDRFAEHPYLTRLFTTMSAFEMDEDPIFDFNADLEPVSNEHWATQLIYCDAEGNPKWDSAIIRVDDGPIFALQDGENPHVIRRMDGATVRGLNTRGAAIIEQTFAAGQPEIILDARDDLLPPGFVEGDCGNCAVGRSSERGAWIGLGLLALLGWRRRGAQVSD